MLELEVVQVARDLVERRVLGTHAAAQAIEQRVVHAVHHVRLEEIHNVHHMKEDFFPQANPNKWSQKHHLWFTDQSAPFRVISKCHSPPLPTSQSP